MSSAIEALFEERRRFPPSPEFASQANATGDLYEQAERDYTAFWAGWARKLEWSKPFTRNAGVERALCEMVRRRGAQRRGQLSRPPCALRDGATRSPITSKASRATAARITYRELLEDVNRFANGLRKLGIRKGDRVAIYMPMIPELPVAMLACARIGAAHSVIFGGFSPESIVDRVNDASCVALITADFGWRRGNKVPLKRNCDIAMERTPTIAHCIVARRVGDDVFMHETRDIWWSELVAGESTECEPEAMNAEALLFLLYTSGTTAKPKGIKHTTAGYLTQAAMTHELVFDLKAERDIYWCTADIGWVTGHSYIVYGPLANGATSVLYEGTPDFPDKDRFWEIVERYGVTILYTAPTAIRTFMKWGTEYPARHDLSSLRLLGTVGEPINPEAWIWYREWIGANTTPVVDTWWQTETGGIMIAPLPGVTTLLPGSATRPLPGIGADIVNDRGESVPLGGGGYVVLTQPWPGMLRGIWGDDERYVQTYWSKVPHRYFAGDGARRDAERQLLVHGSHRRRDERQRAPHLNHGGRKRAGRSSAGRGGGRLREARRDDRPSNLCIRFPQGRSYRNARVGRRAARSRRIETRQVHAPEVRDVYSRASQDAQRQDHAPFAARHRRGAHARGYDHPG